MCGEGGDFLERGLKWLLGVKPLRLAEDSMQDAKSVLKIDPSLQGWPWLPGEAAFIEPTALAMLALECRPELANSRRIHEGLKFIQDRRCQGGGWNVGNPFMFNTRLPARAQTTALVLLSLHRFARENIHPEDIEVLRLEMHRDGGVLALAWGLLTIRILGETDPKAEARLASMQSKNGGWADNPHKTAVSMMALRGRL
jgi:hypothetical protein